MSELGQEAFGQEQVTEFRVNKKIHSYIASNTRVVSLVLVAWILQDKACFVL